MRKPGAYLNEFLKDLRGSMTVEFVTFAPLLIAALVVSFEFGRAFWAYDVVTRDLRAAVRYLSRAPSYSSGSKTQAEALAKTGTPTGTTLHFPWTNSATFAYVEPAIITGQYNDDVRVFTMTANVPVTLSLVDFMNRFLSLSGGAAIATNYTLSVSYQARYIGN
jgi:Flp pilus assembly protein TadG